MDVYVPIRKALAVGGSAALFLGGLTGMAQADPPEVAQVGTIGGTNGVSLEAPPVATGREDVFQKPGRAEDALILGDWLIYPTAFGGVIYDSNVNQSSTPQGSAGIRISPAFLAEDNNDIFKTTLYGNGDGRFYFRDIPNSGTIISARAGGTETYTPLPDLIVNGQADFTRQRDLFSTLGSDQSVATLNPTGVGIAPTSNPVSYDQFTGAASVQKNFSRSFATLGGSVVDVMYDQNSGASTAPSPNGVVYTGIARGGFWIFPVLYGYVEGSLDSRDYATSSLNSSGYRFVGGVGTDQIGLVKGELYVGYQAENYSSNFGTVSSPVYGVRGYYYPLPELTINLSVDESLGVSLLTPTAGTVGTSTKVDSYLVNANYTLGQEWSANGRGGYITTDYIGSSRRDEAWTVGGTVTYNLFRNVGLTLDLQHIELSSNAPAAGFTRDVVTLGATWRY